MRIAEKSLLMAALMACGQAASAGIRLPNTISPGMVLQQSTRARLWGAATPNAQVEISATWTSEKIKAAAGPDGKFLAEVPTPAATFQPQEIQFKDLSDGSTAAIGNVLIGEVWIASGQSNMQMPLKGFPGCFVEGGWDEVSFASREASRVRMITQPPKHSYEPLGDLDQPWTVPSAATAPDYSAVAWHFAKCLSYALDVPVGIVSIAYGGSKVESWMNEESLRKHGYSTRREDIDNCPEDYLKILLPYNAMFCPVKNVTARGIIWYQGESNVGAQNFEPLMRDLVAQWRAEMQLGLIPFYMVEIAPYDYGPGTSGAALRESQYRLCREIPMCGLAGTGDLVLPEEKCNVHPRQKMQVGHRLAWMALHDTYGRQEFLRSGPEFLEMSLDGGKAVVKFGNAPMGIGSGVMGGGFCLAGPDRVFYPADTVTINPEAGTATISSSKVPAPAAVRYCYRNFQKSEIFGGAFLPAYPFRTDTWDNAAYYGE